MATLAVKILGDSSSLERSFRRANASAGGFNRTMSKTGKTSATGQRAFGGLRSSIRLAGASFLGGAGIVAGLTSTLSKTAEFERSLNTFQAVSGATAAQMKAVGAEAAKLGGDITLPGTSAKDAALAMTELAKGGLSVQQSLAAAKGTLQLAAAAEVEVAEAATISARALNAFGLSGDQAGRVADVLANAANVSTGEITDYAMALQQASASSAAAGLTIEDTAAALALMANKGIVGSDAGTSLKTMLARLVPTTKKAHEAMRELGVRYQDADGNLLPLREQIEQYNRALGKLTPAQRQQAIQTIFGSDAQRAANIILGGGVALYDKQRAAVARAGAAAEIAAAKNKGMAGAMDALKSAVETVQIQIGTALAPALTKYLQAAAAWVGNTRNQQMIMNTLRTTMVSVITVLAVLRTAFQTLSAFVGGNRNAVLVLVGAFVAFKALQMASTLTRMAQTFGLLTVRTNAQTAATTRATLASRGFGMSLIGKAGLVAAAGVASFALTSLILKATGLDQKLKSVGASAFDAAAKIGLVKDPGAQFEKKRVLGPKESAAIRRAAGALQATGLTPQQTVDKLAAARPNVARRDIEVLAGLHGAPPPNAMITVNVHQRPGETDQAFVNRIIEAQRKAQKRNVVPRRGPTARRSGR